VWACRIMPDISEFTQSFFNASSKAWKKNKVRYGQAMYKYRNHAFSLEEEIQEVKLTPKQQKQMNEELQIRQRIDEVAPPRERRSPRLRLLHLQQTYSNSGAPDGGLDDGCRRLH
jgi:hypothetical protein